MRKFVCSCVILVLFSCSENKKTIPSIKEKPIEENLNYKIVKHFSVNLGDTIKIVQGSNASTGHQNCWLNSNSIDLVNLIDRIYGESPSDCFGCGVKETFLFVAIKKGKGVIKISSCGTASKHKTCDDYNDSNTTDYNKFYIDVK